MSKKFTFFMAIGVFISIILCYMTLKMFFRVRHDNNKVVFAEKILNETQESKTIIEKTLIAKDKHIDSVLTKVDDEKKKSVELSRKLSEKVNETLIVKDELRKIKKERDKLANKFKQADEKQEKLKEEIEKLKRTKIDLQDRIERMKKNGVASEKSKEYVSMPREQQNKDDKNPNLLEKKKDEGHIVKINKRFNFAVINLGTVDGIRKSQVLKVIRDGVVISDIKIEKTYDKMSAAVIMKNTLKVKELVKGDIVKIISVS